MCTHFIISRWCHSHWGDPLVLVSDECAHRPQTNTHKAYRQNLNNQEAQQMETSMACYYSFLYLASCRFILSLPVSNQTLSNSTHSLVRLSLLAPGALPSSLWSHPWSRPRYRVLRNGKANHVTEVTGQHVVKVQSKCPSLAPSPHSQHGIAAFQNLPLWRQ